MKKVKDILLSFILPRKTARYRNMHFLLAFLIFLVSVFVATGSQYVNSKKYVKKDMDRYEYLESLSQNYDSSNSYEELQNKKIYVDRFLITSDEDLSIDEAKVKNELTSAIMSAKVKGLTKEYDLFVFFSENFDESFLEKEESTLSKEENASIKKLEKNVKEFFKVKTPNSLVFIFTKNGVYYGIDVESVSSSDDTKLSTYLEKLAFFKGNFDQELSFLNRLNKIDVVSFFNAMTQKVGLAEEEANDAYSLKNFDVYANSYFALKGIYHVVLDDKDDKKLDLTIVFDPKYDITSGNKENWNLEHFDYEGYFKQERRVNTTYVLCLFASDRFFYVYDLGQTLKDGKYEDLDYNSGSIFEVEGSKTLHKVYYLPNDASEIVLNEYGEFDTTKWTKKVGRDDQFDFSSIDDTKLDERINKESIKSITPKDRHQNNFYNAIFTRNSRSYIYTDFLSGSFKFNQLNGNLNILLQSIVDTMILIDATNFELVYGMISFCMFALFPFIMCLLVWLVSRKLFMKRYREYYAIASIAYFVSSLVILIVGFFIPFDKLAFPAMFIQAWYFIFVTFRINTDPKYKNENPDETEKPDKKEEIEFKKIKDHKVSEIG